ncbi:MAG: stage V sporulation protein AB [Christensenellales bacterium]
MSDFLAALTGLCTGLVIGGTVSAFFVLLGVFSKTMLALRHKTAGTAMSAGAAAGGVAGTLITIFPVTLSVGGFAAALFGLFSGVYVGIFIACLAEVANMIPLLKKSGFTQILIIVVLLWFMLGKLAGSLVYWISDVF